MTTAELQKLFIKRVRERMHILHIDQRELARRANISEVTISRYINGTICSVEHEIEQHNESFDYKLNIKVY